MSSSRAETRGGATKPVSRRFYDHLGPEVARYVWCQQFVTDLDVLDIGCGYGYGSDFLATTAKTVMAADTDPSAISYGSSHYGRQNLRFLLIDAPSQLEERRFDAVIVLEVIEHVADSSAFISDVCRLLRGPGQLILSTPNLLYFEYFYAKGEERNPYHVHEFYPEEIQNLLQTFFRKVENYGQVWAYSKEMQLRRAVSSKSSVPRSIRPLVPGKLKDTYLRLKGVPWIPSNQDRLGMWRDYPVVPCESVDSTYPHQAYRCTDLKSYPPITGTAKRQKDAAC
jgi:SAM-dependent methyltransferase